MQDKIKEKKSELSIKNQPMEFNDRCFQKHYTNYLDSAWKCFLPYGK